MSVLICYDGSPSARYAVENAAHAMAQAVCSRNDVTLLHVWHEPEGVPADSFCYREDSASPTGERLIYLAEGAAEETIEAGRQLAMEHGIMPHTLLACETVSVAATILRVANERDSSLIVVGAHMRGMPGPTLESTSVALVATSSRPVLVIPMSESAVREMAAATKQNLSTTKRSDLSHA